MKETTTVLDMTRLMRFSIRNSSGIISLSNNRFSRTSCALTRDVYERLLMYDTTSAISQRFYRAFIMIPETPGIALLNQNPFVRLIARGRARAREGEIARTIDR